ncbi:hypothetical protein CBR_g30730 [Chara braunii]|uniref:Uncharacterized protein n=1 Tax=Chara braunii TaxID=69332 RepID=A0A388LDS7_CHABU|nr:hypothetical protein CBR_g30730 [Chara braunii]|eukprot:GBG80362.1 hypothetical protein CBR_g30730 [Chara braunii]
MEEAMPSALPSVSPMLDPVWLAARRLRRWKTQECEDICAELLERNPYDQAVWYLKCRSLTHKRWFDDTEVEEEGFADIMFDQNALAEAPRPGTSLSRPRAQGGDSMINGSKQGIRPMIGNGRPLTGYARPVAISRPGTGSQSLESSLQSLRPGSARPVTASGRYVRLGTPSMVSEKGGSFINVDRLDFRKYVRQPALARVC